MLALGLNEKRQEEIRLYRQDGSFEMLPTLKEGYSLGIGLNKQYLFLVRNNSLLAISRAKKEIICSWRISIPCQMKVNDHLLAIQHRGSIALFDPFTFNPYPSLQAGMCPHYFELHKDLIILSWPGEIAIFKRNCVAATFKSDHWGKEPNMMAAGNFLAYQFDGESYIYICDLNNFSIVGKIRSPYLSRFIFSVREDIYTLACHSQDGRVLVWQSNLMERVQEELTHPVQNFLLGDKLNCVPVRNLKILEGNILFSGHFYPNPSISHLRTESRLWLRIDKSKKDFHIDLGFNELKDYHTLNGNLLLFCSNSCLLEFKLDAPPTQNEVIKLPDNPIHGLFDKKTGALAIIYKNSPNTTFYNLAVYQTDIGVKMLKLKIRYCKICFGNNRLFIIYKDATQTYLAVFCLKSFEIIMEEEFDYSLELIHFIANESVFVLAYKKYVLVFSGETGKLEYSLSNVFRRFDSKVRKTPNYYYLPKITRKITAVALSSDKLVVATLCHSVKIFDLPTGKLLFTLPTKNKKGQEIFYSARRRDFFPRFLKRMYENENFSLIAISGSYMAIPAIIDLDCLTIELWDIAARKLCRTFAIHEARIEWIGNQLAGCHICDMKLEVDLEKKFVTLAAGMESGLVEVWQGPADTMGIHLGPIHPHG